MLFRHFCDKLTIFNYTKSILIVVNWRPHTSIRIILTKTQLLWLLKMRKPKITMSGGHIFLINQSALYVTVMHCSYELLLLGMFYTFIVGKVGQLGMKDFLNSLILRFLIQQLITVCLMGVISTGTSYVCAQSCWLFFTSSKAT